MPSALLEPARFSVRLARLLADRVRPAPNQPGAPRGLALIHRGRCGSTVLGSLLDQNPYIYWDGEAIYHHGSSERWLRWLQGARGAPGVGYLRALMRYAKGRTYVLSAVGRSAGPGFAQLVEDLLAAGFDRFAILERRNILRRVVSVEIGQQYQAWSLRRGRAPRLKPVSVPLTDMNGRTLVERLRVTQDWYAEARRALSSQPTLELDYETQVLPDPVTAYRRVCEYLGVEGTAVRPRYERVNPFPLRQLILNYREVASALRGTEFEWMLTD